MPTDSSSHLDRLLVSIPEGGAMLGLGRSTLYKLIKAKELSIVKVGRSVRIPTQELRRWASEQAHLQGDD